MQIFEDHKRLWDRFIEGDEEAFSKIYKINIQRLFQFGLCFTQDEELIKDCIHDVFVTIYKKRSEISSVDNISGYLSIALRNKLLNHFIKNNPQKITRLNDCEFFEERYGYYTNPFESDIIKKETDRGNKIRLQRLLDILTVRQREIISYRYVYGMKIHEISKLTNMNTQSVSNIIQRALTKIRKYLKKNMEK